VAMSSCPSEGEIQEYIDGELAGEQTSRLASHIRLCPDCRRLYQRLMAISQSLANQPPPVASERLKDTILQATSRTRPVRAVSCRAAQRLISAYLDGELSPKQQQQCEAHIFTCPDCYRIFKQSQQVVAVLHAVPPVTVPAGLDKRVHHAVTESVAANEPEIIGYVGKRISWRTVGVALAGAAAAAVIVLGLILAPQNLPGPHQPPATIVAERPATPPAVESVADTASNITDSTETAKEPPTPPQNARGPRLANARGPRSRPSGLGVTSKPARPAPEVTVSGEEEVAGEPQPATEPGSVPAGPPAPAAPPPSTELAPAERTKPGPTIVMVKPTTTAPTGPAGPGLATLPTSPQEPIWAPVRTGHKAIYHSEAEEFNSDRLAAVAAHLNQQIAQLKSSGSTGRIVIK